jgi:tetratricopeptide (TPR) repeat protein
MLTPDDAWAHCAFGNELRQMGYLHRAKDELEMAIDLNPDIPFAYREMGKLFSEMGEYHKALKYLKIAREKHYHLVGYE